EPEAKREAEPEPEVEVLPAVVPAAEPVGFFASASNRAEEEWKSAPLVLSRADPFVSVKKLVAARAWRREEGVPTLRFSQGMFWAWNGQHWVELEEKKLRNHLWRHLGAACRQRDERIDRFQPKPADLNAFLDALAGYLDVDEEVGPMPDWFG